MSETELVPVFMPLLGAILLAAEDKKGAPLSEEEVIAIRDKASVMMMRRGDAQKMDEKRGRDIDPQNCWHDFQKLRESLGRTPLPAGPKFSHIRDSDPELEQAVVMARASIPEFRRLLNLVKNGKVIKMVKVKLIQESRSVYMWLTDAQECSEGFSGALFEVPKNFNQYHRGQRLTVAVEEIYDWAILDNGCLQGGFSIRVFRGRKPESERAEFDKYIGAETYAPLPAV